MILNRLYMLLLTFFILESLICNLCKLSLFFFIGLLQFLPKYRNTSLFFLFLAHRFDFFLLPLPCRFYHFLLLQSFSLNFLLLLVSECLLSHPFTTILLVLECLLFQSFTTILLLLECLLFHSFTTVCLVDACMFSILFTTILFVFECLFSLPFKTILLVLECLLSRPFKTVLLVLECLLSRPFTTIFLIPECLLSRSFTMFSILFASPAQVCTHSQVIEIYLFLPVVYIFELVQNLIGSELHELNVLLTNVLLLLYCRLVCM